MTKYGLKAQDFVENSMHKMKKGTLESGKSHMKVKDRETGHCHWPI
jgi:hypothetical protein